MPKIILSLIIFFVCIIIGGTHEYSWNFSYLAEEFVYINKEKPEFKELLEQLHSLIKRGRYSEVSWLLRKEISSYNLATHDLLEFESLYVLLRIDASVDYHLRNMRRQGANKMYVMGYFLSRLWDDEYGLPFKRGWIQVSPDLAKEHPYLDPSWLMLAGIVNNHSAADTFLKFIDAVEEKMPILNLGTGWFSEYAFSEEETEHLIIDYWNADETTDIHVEFFSTPRDLLYDFLVHDLFFLSDYSEDIRIFCDPGVQWLCQDAVDLISSDIPIIDRIRDNRELFTNIVDVCVTFKRTRAEMFFNRYYGAEELRQGILGALDAHEGATYNLSSSGGMQAYLEGSRAREAKISKKEVQATSSGRTAKATANTCTCVPCVKTGTEVQSRCGAVVPGTTCANIKRKTMLKWENGKGRVPI